MSAAPAGCYAVAVRELCAFAATAGDLDLRFTPAPTAQEGMAGHRAVTLRRSASYRTEVTLSGRCGSLFLRGRADGYDAQACRVEEIKTFRGDLSRQAANQRALHWAQARVYGWLLCVEHGLSEIEVALVYFDIDRQEETPLVQHCSADELQRFAATLCERFEQWAARQLAHRRERDAALDALVFPHPSFRPGQRQLAESVFKAARLGRCLMAQAPTGIGKTLGTLFPLLKACPSQELDKIFYLTAKGSGRAPALQALDALRAAAPGLPIRVVELIARDKSCEHPDKTCHGDSCPLARGFFDRLPAAREAAVSVPQLTRSEIRAVALAHAVCPYYLSQELVRWADVVIADYNHFYDGSALLHAFMQANQWRVAVLVDEAHNLVERARDMYTAPLAQARLAAARRSAPPALRRPLDRLQRAWRAGTRDQGVAYQVHDAPPRAVVSALREFVSATNDWLAEAAPTGQSPLLEFYFDALHFNAMLERFDSHSLVDVSLDPAPADGRTRRRASTLCIRNLLPAPFLSPRFAASRTTILFSATLAPSHYYADTLGLPADTACLEVEPPFESAQLSVHIARSLSTRFRDRAGSLEPIARLIAGQYADRPGNYLAFFSSFDYLERALAVFASRFTEIPHWQQARRMNDAERADFLARFVPDGRGIGFAVLGGAFAEGIDLPGTRLVGAFIATLGLPQVNPVNEEMRRRFDATFGAGYDYTYLFPGLRKVVQAAGRVIRTPSDRGTLHLLDERFSERM